MTGIEITGDPADDENLEQAEQEAIDFAKTITDATEDAAQPKPLNAVAEEVS